MANENIYDVDAVDADVCEEVEDTSTTSGDVTETVEDTTTETPEADENYGIATQPSANASNPVVASVATQASDTSDGQSWTSYTTASELADDDEIMALDTSAKANKRTLLSILSDFILDKLATKVYEKLGTQNKTVIGALNELNSKRDPLFVYDGESDSIDHLISKIISSVKGSDNGIYTTFGSWTNHASGYSAIVSKCIYTNELTKIIGIIFASDGNCYNFASDIRTDGNITTKKSLFTIQ